MDAEFCILAKYFKFFENFVQLPSHSTAYATSCCFRRICEDGEHGVAKRLHQRAPSELENLGKKRLFPHRPKSGHRTTYSSPPMMGSHLSLFTIHTVGVCTNLTHGFMLQVAQQVMSLFEGALNVEKQLEALELEEQLEQNEETQRAADLNSPSKTNGHDISISVEQVTVQNRL